ncbi:hypothetical protein GCM10008090_19160 [Arenicella chitinivorans]|uniref:Uncharacterized protein n=1 Tax=Arenicella chitinivorans TaxID=1329800 RepID=A0A918RSH5_9GAMM|nr:hypothetical protein GCM10008090_19160 [Arenicella chitinivorans]
MYGAWKRFIKLIQNELGQHDSNKFEVGINIAKKLENYPQEKFDEVLRDFSNAHERDFGQLDSPEDVVVSSNEILGGLEAELDGISEEEDIPGAVVIAIDSIKDLLTSLPPWISNSLVFLKELFQLLGIRK